jgi:hypothetical protein
MPSRKGRFYRVDCAWRSESPIFIGRSKYRLRACDAENTLVGIGRRFERVDRDIHSGHVAAQHGEFASNTLFSEGLQVIEDGNNRVAAAATDVSGLFFNEIHHRERIGPPLRIDIAVRQPQHRHVTELSIHRLPVRIMEVASVVAGQTEMSESTTSSASRAAYFPGKVL